MGISHQQVQKYERGINRVSAGRLRELADILRVPSGWFFEDIGEDEQMVANISGHGETDGLLPTTEGCDVCRAIRRIRSEDRRLAILRLVRAIAETEAVAP